MHGRKLRWRQIKKEDMSQNVGGGGKKIKKDSLCYKHSSDAIANSQQQQLHTLK